MRDFESFPSGTLARQRDSLFSRRNLEACTSFREPPKSCVPAGSRQEQGLPTQQDCNQTPSRKNIRTPSGPTLSVLIPTLGRPGFLHRTLRSLSAQTSPAGGFEVVVAIDGPDAGTAEAVSRLKTPYRLVVVDREKNGGRAAACNSALAAANGRLVLFLDDDVSLEPGALTAHVAAHEQCGEVAYLGLAYPRSPGRASLVGMWTEKRYAALVSRLIDEGAFRSPRDASTVNFSVARDTAKTVGGFWEGFKAYGKEDVEFIHRLNEAGVQLRLLPEARLHHWFEKRLALFVRQREQVAQNDLKLRELHPEMAQYLECDRDVPGWSMRKRVVFRGLATTIGESDRLLNAACGLLEELVTPGSTSSQPVVELAREFGYYRGLRAAGFRFGPSHDRDSAGRRS
jgi:glycosyltransferase involved in cell wall biosynthesis